MQTYDLPAAIKGNFDHFDADLKRRRLFVTAEDSQAILVFNIDSGNLMEEIHGVLRPDAVLYRADVDRLYIIDGNDGSVKVFDGNKYQQIARIPLLKDADSIGFDISRHYLYVDNGGGDVGQIIFVVDNH